jgi:hypothetical protein
MENNHPPAWRIASLMASFLLAMAFAVGLKSNDVPRALAVAAVVAIIIGPVMYLSYRFARTSDPATVIRMLKLLLITGIALTTIGSAIALIMKK